MVTIRLPRWGAFRPFTRAGAKRGAFRDGISSPIPDAPVPAQTRCLDSKQLPATVCGICSKVIAEGEATVKIRHGATSKDPTPPLLPAHSVCFRQELLPRW